LHRQPAACRQTATDCYLHVVSQVLYGTLVVALRFAAVGAGTAAASTDTAIAAATAGAVGRAGVSFESASSDLAACETLQPAALHCVPSAGSRLLEWWTLQSAVVMLQLQRWQHDTDCALS
jgi:hypothetical protein